MKLKLVFVAEIAEKEKKYELNKSLFKQRVERNNS